MAKPGIPVTFEFSSADATTAAPFIIYNEDGTVVTVASDERLIVDGLGGNIVTGAGEVIVLGDTDADGAVDPGERVAAMTNINCSVTFDDEGRVGKPGIGLKAKAAVAGQVTIIGGGRIVKNGGLLTRPSWKEAERGH